MPRARPKKTIFHRVLKWAGILLSLFVALSVLEVALLRVVDPRFTPMWVWQWISHMAGGEDVVPQMDWRPLEKMSPHIRRAVIAAEDQRFLSHNGFDVTEIRKAIREMTLGKGFRGASTISMQTARTVFLWPSRGMLRKGLEAYFTVLIEILWGKARILEIYLNTVDWGEGVMGVETASQRYYHVSASQLSREQAALLAAILPSPHRWSPTHPGPHTLWRQQRILRDMASMPLVVRRHGEANHK